jgi:hypothetical protein
MIDTEWFSFKQALTIQIGNNANRIELVRDAIMLGFHIVFTLKSTSTVNLLNGIS